MKDRSVVGDEPARQIDDLARTAPVLAELRLGANLEVVRKIAKDARVCAGPRVDRLLVVANSEHVLVLIRQRADDLVLARIQILEFVYEDGGPPLPNLRR